MIDPHDDTLARIAAALERLAPPLPPVTDWREGAAFMVTADGPVSFATIDAPPLHLLRGMDRQKAKLYANIERLAAGAAAHDMLLWGARGTGKSALIRAATVAARAEHGGDALALVQIAPDSAARSLPMLFAELGKVDRRFLLFLDDLGFDPADGTGARLLRSVMEGGVAGRPGNTAVAVTANRRAIVARDGSEQADPLHPRDTAEDSLALADRFGLTLGFHAPTQETYLEIVGAYADHYGLTYDEAEALAWARGRGSRAGRTARQFITEIAGRAGVPLRS